MKLTKLIVTAFLFYSYIIAQPNHETRAVWLATNFRLDWPPPVYNEETQKKALTDILDNLVRKNFNTVYFQVLFNGTAIYKSSIVPMSYYISGEMDDSSAYDPLQFMIDECHKRGLEIHAWINALRCFTGTEKFIKEHPKHVMSLHPDWVVEKFIDNQITYWLNPGLPQVRDYLIQIADEIINNYDIDGLQLDFLRYPSKEFNDEISFKKFSGKLNKDDWRRQNINNIVSEIHELIKHNKPSVRFGITPIGIYQNIKDAKGLQGFSDVYQDTKLWLKNSWIDYAVPQIYWDFNNNPKFDVVANDWIENSGGKNIVLGIAAYKNEVLRETEKMIQFSRQINSAGISFFRYDNIKNLEIASFSKKAFPAKMPWIDDEQPAEIENLYSLLNTEKNSVKLYWNFPDTLNQGNEAFYSAIYKLSDDSEKCSVDNLFGLFPIKKKSIQFSIKNPEKINYFFTMKTLDRFWNESLSRSNVVKFSIPYLSEIVRKFDSSNKPMLIKNMNGEFFIIIYSATDQKAEFDFNTGSVHFSRNLQRGINTIHAGTKITEVNSAKIFFPASGKSVALIK
jgi:uncharacterized lipoprotein YddW (UPF0748 family)